jgi:hypothetical protein
MPLQLFLVQGLLIGCGLGLVFLPSATICMFHFKERKALMTGIAMSGSCFGAMIYPISAFVSPFADKTQQTLPLFQ